ncbi:MAG: MBL fold metallo-hydrolase [Acidimicrobiales bacterium]
MSHLHWDHVQGIPFFPPVLSADSQLTIVAPPQPGDDELADVFNAFLRPPMFPVRLDDLPGNISFVTRSSGSFSHGALQVGVVAVQHNGATNGYRIDEAATGQSVAYISDHQQPCGDPTLSIRPYWRSVMASMYSSMTPSTTTQSLRRRRLRGHSTVRYAVEVARQAGVKELYLFHHDPSHSDEWVAAAVADANDIAGGQFVVRAATEGLTFSP